MKNPFARIREESKMTAEAFAEELKITPEYLGKLERCEVERLPYSLGMSLRECGYKSKKIAAEYKELRKRKGIQNYLEVHKNGNKL